LFDFQTISSSDRCSSGVFVSYRSAIKPVPVRFDVVVAAKRLHQTSRGQAVSGKLQREFDSMPRVVQDRKHESVALLEHLLVDDSARKLNRRFNVAVKIVLLVYLFADAGVPLRIVSPLKEWIVLIRVCLSG
jgi:hypothetical protein